MSEPEFRRVGLVAKPHSPGVVPEITRLAEYLVHRDVSVVFGQEAASLLGHDTPGVPREELASHVDLLVVLGGDGTLLSVARAAAAASVPVFGANYGGMGFLTATPPTELMEGVARLLDGEYTVSERQMLRAGIRGDSREHPVLQDVLNDAVVTKTDLARIVQLSVHVGGELVSRFRADGLIVCTATGSTAYSLAAGGPIVAPQVDAIVLTPICPHTLTNRPIVLPGDAEVEIRQVGDDQEVMLTLDGQAGFVLVPGEVVRVVRSPVVLRLLQPHTRSYFEVLSTKLAWGQG